MGPPHRAVPTPPPPPPRPPPPNVPRHGFGFRLLLGTLSSPCRPEWHVKDHEEDVDPVCLQGKHEGVAQVQALGLSDFKQPRR